MSYALDIADRLAADAAFLQESGRVETAEAMRLNLAGAPWEAALGVRTGWLAVVKQRQRDKALVQLLAAVGPMRWAPAGEKISAIFLAYETTAWQADRLAGRRPPGVKGAAYDYLCGEGPTSAERLRKILPLVTEKLPMTRAA